MATPTIFVIAGPNGAGKSTCSPLYIPPGMAYLNADEVAKTLPNYPSSAADLEAGRIVLDQMADLESRGEGFAFETTLATRALASRVARLRVSGYLFHLVYVWSPNVDFSIRRVAARVRAGGHHIPEDTIRRRYAAGLANFFSLYRPLADHWEMVDNSNRGLPRLIAAGSLGDTMIVEDSELWDQIRSGHES
ncbi:zeta toxin family protein [Tundrisphaera sp. TA3]|uniref:zeta toxin family protein n=1 Tax=Tundrisphaera sp. TA3 TaxID=3435775 RepID=UPI003EBE64EC